MFAFLLLQALKLLPEADLHRGVGGCRRRPRGPTPHDGPRRGGQGQGGALEVAAAHEVRTSGHVGGPRYRGRRRRGRDRTVVVGAGGSRQSRGGNRRDGGGPRRLLLELDHALAEVRHIDPGVVKGLLQVHHGPRRLDHRVLLVMLDQIRQSIEPKQKPHDFKLT